MYGLFLIAVKSAAIHTFLYFNISEVQLQHVKELSQIPELVGVWWIDCHSWDNSCMRDEIWYYKAKDKDKCDAMLACGNYQEYDDNEIDTYENDRDLICHDEAGYSQTTSIKAKYKNNCDVMTGVKNAYFPIKHHALEKHAYEDLACHYETLTHYQATGNRQDLCYAMTQTRANQPVCSVQSGQGHSYNELDCLSKWRNLTTSRKNYKVDESETMTETWIYYRHRSEICMEHPRHEPGCCGEVWTGNETLGEKIGKADTTVSMENIVCIKCRFYSMTHLCRNISSSEISLCGHETCRNQKTDDNDKSKVNMCNIKSRACENYCHCSKKYDSREEHKKTVLDGSNNSECRYKSCNTEMRLIGEVKGTYVNMLLYVILCLFFICILKCHCVKLCCNTVYAINCNPCSLYDLNLEEKNIEKWNLQNISKHRETLTWLVTISELLCAEPNTAKFRKSHTFSEITNYLYSIESHIKKTKDNVMSILCELQADFIRVPQVTAYPLLLTLNNYLSRVQNEGSIRQDEEMCYEVRRFQSYNSVPVQASPMRLARSGFYATGSGDETRCYSCRMTYSDWKMMDQPDQIHRSMFPDCPHLNRGDQRNVPILSSTRDDDVTSVCGVIGEYSTMIGSSETMTSQPVATAATPTASEAAAAASASSGVSSPDLPGLDISRAVYPQYRDLSSRLDSYQGWGWSHVQDPQVLARAGFYYAGYRDCARCFYCGVGLRTWEREDDPWVEHVRWRSSCDYVRVMRGEQFAIQALANDPSVPSSFPPPTNNQTQNTQVAVIGDGMDAAVKAEEMGFQRDLIERAVVDLTASQNVSRGAIPLETLLEKLLIPNDDHHTTPALSASLPVDTPSTTSIPSGQQTESPSSADQLSTNGYQITTSVTVTPFTGAAADDSISTSITRQKAVGAIQPRGNTKTTKTDQESNTAGDGTEVLSSSQERQLEEENQSLREESTCKVCMDNPSCIVFLPCGHLVTCAECAPALRKCPICRALIRGTVRAQTVSSENVKI